MSDLLGDGQIRVSFARSLPPEPEAEPVELTQAESISDDLASVLAPRRRVFKVTRWPTGLTHVEELDSD